MASVSMKDATLITQATIGKIISEGQVNTPSLSDAAIVKLVAFITQMKTDGVVMGTPGHLVGCAVSRVPNSITTPGTTGKISCSLNGLIVYPDALTAIRQRDAFPGVTQEIIGEVVA
jgi:hypothetical protein